MESEVSKDTVDYVYLSDNERYADLFNGVLFGGEQILDSAGLEERDTKAVVSKAKTKARDLIRKYDKDTNYAVLGVENQEKVSYCMPFRMLQYETAEYAKQVAAVNRKNKRTKMTTDGEFLEKYRKKDKLHPCVSLVLYWGIEWDGPITLQDMLDMENVPEYLKGYVNDYTMHLVNVRELPDTSVFKTDLRQVFDFMKCAEDVEKVKKLVLNNPDYMHLDMDAYDMMMIHGHSQILEKIRENVKQEDGNLCKGLTDWGKQERELGREEGRAEGLAEGRVEGLAEGRAEGRAEATEIGLKALINTIRGLCSDFEDLYRKVIANECYKDMTKEQVMKYV